MLYFLVFRADLYRLNYIRSAKYHRIIPIPRIPYHLKFFLFVKIVGEPNCSSRYVV
ncbi:hypothetical protein NPIRD3C_0546 [Nitrosopumilus piranensis]|uniref:Uncharacterized protein n=1 Tax=Nitrosopumilus piranensis TaxID=1582439 RepID=A0A0C5BXQ4_9ARCH|nr:hypothetical protein NPIRD3C_0546 [Nitrosopumilus piranensis]